MAFLAVILVLLSLHAIVEATELKFSKIKGNIYAEIDEKHFAIYGPVIRTASGTVRHLSLEDEGMDSFNNCEATWTVTKNIPAVTMSDCSKVRDLFLGEKRLPEESPDSYTWSDTFSSDQKVFSVTKLDADTYVYASPYLPSTLARLIISGPYMITFYYDGKVQVKSVYCQYMHEKILLAGINKIDTSGKKPLLASSGDKVLKKYLKNNGFDERRFRAENRDNSKTYTDAEYANMQAAAGGGGARSLDGWKP